MDRRLFLKAISLMPLTLFSPGALKKSVARVPDDLLLLETVVAGFQYYRGESFWNRLRTGDPLRLERETKNRHDEKAVELYWEQEKLGYLPRVDNAVISQIMDRGAKLAASISQLRESSDPWKRVGVKVVMNRGR